MSLLTRMTRGGRTNEKLDLIPYFDHLLNHVDNIRAPLRSYRKFLENSHSLILKMSHTEKLEKGSEDSPLYALITIQQQCCDIQIKFADEVGTFMRLLKDWENLCESIMKSKSDLQKASANKERDRLRASDGYKLSESTYQIQRDELYKMLTRYFSSEVENRKKAKEFQTKLFNFLTHCRDQVEQSSTNVQPSSSPTVSDRVFTGSLAGHLDTEGYSVVLKSTLAYLTKNKAYAREGIFRVPGQVSSINLLKDAFERGMADEELFDCCGVFEVADLMKQYLRDLPEPILPTDLLTNWPTDSERPNPEVIKSLLNQYVDEPNRRNLFLVLEFLCKVVENQSSSKMTPDNLTVTLWKSFRSNSENFNVPRVVQCLITNAKALTEDEPTLLHSQPLQPRREKKEGGRPKPPPPPRPNPPSQTHSYSPQISTTELAAPSVEKQMSVPKPSASPKLVTNFNGPDGRPKSEIHLESDRATPEIPLRAVDTSGSMGQCKAPATKEQVSDITVNEEKSKEGKEKDVPKEESESESSKESVDETSEDSPTTTSTSSSEEEEEEEKKVHKKLPKTAVEKTKKTKPHKKSEKVEFDEEEEKNSKGQKSFKSKKEKSNSGSDEESSSARNHQRSASSAKVESDKEKSLTSEEQKKSKNQKARSSSGSDEDSKGRSAMSKSPHSASRMEKK